MTGAAGIDSTPQIDDMQMMTPFDLASSARAASTVLVALQRFSAKTRCHSSGVSSPGGSDRGIGPNFRATVAGAGNVPGGVLERLSTPGPSFTGIYRRGYQSPGGYAINHYADARPSTYAGHTNAGTNEVVHDISRTLRPNVVKSPAGAPAFRP